MKRRFFLFTLLFMMVLGLTGCTSKEEKRSQIYEYTNINTLFINIVHSSPLPIGDWGYGAENRDAYKADFNVDAPVFSIHVNPFADDELLDMYVENLRLINDYMAQNGEYMKYIKKNHPYYASFDCLSEDILVVELDGKTDTKKVREDLEAALIPASEKAKEKLDKFAGYMKTNKDINQAENGEYYYILDSKNVSESIKSVMENIEKIRAEFPFTMDEINGLRDSFSRLGMLGDGYQIYFDSYGNDPLWTSACEFAYTAKNVYNSVYSHFVETGSFDEGSLRTYYYCHMYEDKNQAFGGYDCHATMTKEEVADTLWNIYDGIMKEHEEHGIKAISELGLSGICFLTDDPDGMSYETKLDIPMEILDERIPKERFYDMVEESSRVFDRREYEME